MKRLYLLRHAKSSWDDPGLADDDRPLAPRGRRAADRLGRHCKREGIRPALVLCSSATRARDTLERVRPGLGPPAPVEPPPRQVAATAADRLGRERPRAQTRTQVFVVGHKPGLQDLALLLVREEAGRERLEGELPTGTLATLTLRRLTWSGLHPGEAELTELVRPRDLG